MKIYWKISGRISVKSCACLIIYNITIFWVKLMGSSLPLTSGQEASGPGKFWLEVKKYWTSCSTVYAKLTNQRLNWVTAVLILLIFIVFKTNLKKSLQRNSLELLVSSSLCILNAIKIGDSHAPFFFLAIWLTFITYLFLHDGFQHANHKATIPSEASTSLLL